MYESQVRIWSVWVRLDWSDWFELTLPVYRLVIIVWFLFGHKIYTAIANWKYLPFFSILTLNINWVNVPRFQSSKVCDEFETRLSWDECNIYEFPRINCLRKKNLWKDSSIRQYGIRINWHFRKSQACEKSCRIYSLLSNLAKMY